MMSPTPGLRRRTLNGPPSGPGFAAEEFATLLRGPERIASYSDFCSGVRFSGGICLKRCGPSEFGVAMGRPSGIGNRESKGQVSRTWPPAQRTVRTVETSHSLCIQSDNLAFPSTKYPDHDRTSEET